MRFLIVKINKDFNTLFKEQFLDKQGFMEVYGMTGGDDDFICVDTLNKEWCYCEYGFAPFCSEYEMDTFQTKDKNFRLKELVELSRNGYYSSWAEDED